MDPWALNHGGREPKLDHTIFANMLKTFPQWPRLRMLPQPPESQLSSMSIRMMALLHRLMRTWLCVICQDNLRPGDPTTTMWCSHVFHSSCLTEWRVCARKDSEQCPFFCENSPAMAMHRFLEESCVAEVFLTWVLLSNECGLEK